MGPSPKLAAKLPQIRLVCSPECKRSLAATRIKGALVSGSDDDPPQIVDQTTSAAVDECSPTFEYLGSSAGCGICEGECRHPFAKVSVVTLFLQVADGCEPGVPMVLLTDTGAIIAAFAVAACILTIRACATKASKSKWFLQSCQRNAYNMRLVILAAWLM